MHNNANKPDSEFGYKPKLEFESRADATVLWFAAAVLFAVIAAGTIIYRSGNADFRTASNDAAPAAASNPIAPPAILPSR